MSFKKTGKVTTLGTVDQSKVQNQERKVDIETQDKPQTENDQK